MTIFTICAAFYAYYKMFCCYSNMFPLISMSNCPVVVAILEFWSIHLISLLIRVPIEVRKYIDIIDIYPWQPRGMGIGRCFPSAG